MKNNFTQAAVLAVALIGCGLPAMAGVYSVEDPGTPEYQHVEENTGITANKVAGGEAEQPQTEINYGYSNNLQLTLSAGVVSLRPSGERRTTGLDDSGAGVKWRFQEETKKMPQIALAYALKIPTASAANGGTGRADHALLVTALKTFGRTSLFSNIGFNIFGSSDQKNNVFLGAATTYQLTENTTLGAQVYGNSSAAAGQKGELAWGVIVTRDLQPDRTLQVEVGRSTQGFSDLNVYVGMQFVLNTGHSSEKPDADAKPGADAEPDAAAKAPDAAKSAPSH